MQLKDARSPVLRITPMVVLDDIKPALTRYEGLGLTPVPSGDGGCVGMATGHTALILASAAFMRGDFDDLHVDSLVGQTIEYVHVTSIRQVTERLSATAQSGDKPHSLRRLASIHNSWNARAKNGYARSTTSIVEPEPCIHVVSGRPVGGSFAQKHGAPVHSFTTAVRVLRLPALRRLSRDRARVPPGPRHRGAGVAQSRAHIEIRLPGHHPRRALASSRCRACVPANARDEGIGRSSTSR